MKRTTSRRGWRSRVHAAADRFRFEQISLERPTAWKTCYQAGGAGAAAWPRRCPRLRADQGPYVASRHSSAAAAAFQAVDTQQIVQTSTSRRDLHWLR